MVDPVPGEEAFNAGGAELTRSPDTISATQQAKAEAQNITNASDNMWVAQVKADMAAGNPSLAQQDLQQIQDPSTRMSLAAQVYGNKGDQSTPTALFQDGNSGIKDPLALFFMMVFYLDKSAPSFSWKDVLLTAQFNAGSNTNFNSTNPDAGFMPQAKLVQTPKPIVTVNKNKSGTPAPTEDPKFAAENAANIANFNKQWDANAQPVPATTQAPESAGGVSQVAIWPIQNMPTIASGFNKTVDWPFTSQIPTMAEPLLAINKGGSNIDIDIEFIYVVGLPGIGDGAHSVSSDGTMPGDPAKENYWTVKEVMGMMYLAQSLVYPFESVPVTGVGADNAATAADFDCGCPKNWGCSIPRHLPPSLQSFSILDSVCRQRGKDRTRRESTFDDHSARCLYQSKYPSIFPGNSSDLEDHSELGKCSLLPAGLWRQRRWRSTSEADFW